MLIGSIVFATGASAVLSIRPSVRRVCVRFTRGFLRSAAYVGYMTYPAARVDWERVRYEGWLRQHAQDAR